MNCYMVYQADTVSQARELGVRLQVPQPPQLTVGTALGRVVAATNRETMGSASSRKCCDAMALFWSPTRLLKSCRNESTTRHSSGAWNQGFRRYR
jgi:hypothetical protein